MLNNILIIVQVLLKMILIQLPSILILSGIIALIINFTPRNKLLRAYKSILYNLYN